MNSLLKKSLVLLSLIPLIVLFTNAGNPNTSTRLSYGSSFSDYYRKAMNSIDDIYSVEHSRRPTNRLGYFHGDHPRLMHKEKVPNVADRYFGRFLYYTYDMYCLTKFKKGTA